MSQKDEILALLCDAGPRGICLADVPRDLSYTLRNRISELRRQGKDVRSELCLVHAHDGTVSRYTLIPEPIELPSSPYALTTNRIEVSPLAPPLQLVIL